MLDDLDSQTNFNHLMRKASVVDISLHRLCNAEIDKEKDKPYYNAHLDTIIETLNQIKAYLNDKKFINDNKSVMIEELQQNFRTAPELIKRSFKYLIKVLQDYDNKMYLRYDRDIIILALSLLDNYINTLNSSYLKEELIKVKYNASIVYPFLTVECVEKKFDFTGEIFIVSDAIAEMRSYLLNKDENYSLDTFALSVIDVHASKFLNVKYEDFISDASKAAEALFNYFMIESAMSFLSYDLSFDYFEYLIERYNVTEEEYAFKLLVTLMESKAKSRGRINKVSFKPYEK